MATPASTVHVRTESFPPIVNAATGSAKNAASMVTFLGENLVLSAPVKD